MRILFQNNLKFVFNQLDIMDITMNDLINLLIKLFLKLELALHWVNWVLHLMRHCCINQWKQFLFSVCYIIHYIGRYVNHLQEIYLFHIFCVALLFYLHIFEIYYLVLNIFISFYFITIWNLSNLKDFWV